MNDHRQVHMGNTGNNNSNQENKSFVQLFKKYFYILLNYFMQCLIIPFNFIVMKPLNRISHRLPVIIQRIEFKMHTHYLRFYGFPNPEPVNIQAEKIIIFLPQIGWNNMNQRPHHLPRAFWKAGWTVIFLTQDIDNDKIIGIKEIKDRFYICSRVRMLKNIKNPWIYSQYTMNKYYLKYFREYKLIYDHVDRLEIQPFYSKKMDREQKEMLKEAKVVMASSSSLQDEILGLRKDTLLIPNAVFPEDFVLNDDMPVPEDLQGILAQKKFIAGYYGIFSKWKIDYDLLKFLSRQMPDFNFVFIGPDYDQSRHDFEWSDFSNIYFLGKKDYHVLPLYARHFNVALLPLIVNDVTNAISPVKLFEFLAMKLPIVASPIAECQNFKSVLPARDHNEFMQQIRNALTLKNDPAHIALMEKDLSLNTWDYRCEKILERIDEVS